MTTPCGCKPDLYTVQTPGSDPVLYARGIDTTACEAPALREEFGLTRDRLAATVNLHADSCAEVERLRYALAIIWHAYNSDRRLNTAMEDQVRAALEAKG